MSFRPEPVVIPADNGTADSPHTAVLLCNLGTPDAPDASSVRRFLAEFLGDPRVVEIPPFIWKTILHGIILRIRPRASAAKYKTVWTPEGSPLKVQTERQTTQLEAALKRRGQNVIVRYAMRYGNPSTSAQLDALKAQGIQRIVILPLYPQYSGTTTASSFDAIYEWAKKIRVIPEFRFVNSFPSDPGYIASLAAKTHAYWAKHGTPDKLVMSFHGVPERTRALGDPYYEQCMQTGKLLTDALSIPSTDCLVTFQSRFGKAKWLEPYTEPTLIELGKSGVGRVDVMCPGFTSDCLETLEEISQEAREAFLHAGGKEFHYIDCLNDDPIWIEALADIAQAHLPS